MNEDAPCTKILLAKNAAGRVGYCEACDVVELEIGAISIRIIFADLHYISQLLKEADANMAHYRLAKSYEERQSALSVRAMH